MGGPAEPKHDRSQKAEILEMDEIAEIEQKRLHSVLSEASAVPPAGQSIVFRNPDPTFMQSNTCRPSCDARSAQASMPLALLPNRSSRGE